jgi:RNA polymerase sigma factor (sigma-70 family)
MAIEDRVRQAMLDAIPHLRAFAISLAGNITYADDLVQGALLRGLENLDKFQPGTSMQAWLFTILRNQFYTDMRRSRREVDDPEGALAAKLAVMPAQGAHLDFSDMQTALSHLSAEQRITNAVKYAFPAARSGTILVRAAANRAGLNWSSGMMGSEYRAFGKERSAMALFGLSFSRSGVRSTCAAMPG